MRNRTPKYIELKIDAMAFEGVAIGRSENKVYFIKNAVPGDTVKAQIFKSKKSYSEGVVVDIIEKSAHRTEPECQYFGVCGGCSWQNLEYTEQLNWKAINVKDAFERIGKFTNFINHPIIASDKIYHFRNKMEFTFGANRWLTQEEIDTREDIDSKHFALGLHPLGRYDKVIDMEYCKIQDSYADDILNAIRKKANQLELSAYNVRTFEGFLRNLIIRHSSTYDNFLVILVTNSINNDNEDIFIEWLKDEFAVKFNKIISLFHAINNTNNPVTVNKLTLLSGIDHLKERILDIEYKVSPYSFFQTNTYQLNNFIEHIINTTKLDKNTICWDLFCGAGSITFPLSKKCNKVIGIELSKSSINDANVNKYLNHIENVDFVELDLNIKNIEAQLNQLPKPDVLFLDPPRAGLSKNLIDFINNSGINKVVYVSCNPATQARDCDLMREHYKLISVQAVDMFPQTYHIENIALLEKSND
ncbi:MAG TPA: 23S rRNA (uracil(1939)-C(5))-methyltransferase RlmD [Candidatus Kapabacteria bacterium]|nr:23S rRNA (uracil(1939)-C(5))-methyltransferase RlmD [Candidatus Kapabacteria bacterium]